MIYVVRNEASEIVLLADSSAQAEAYVKTNPKCKIEKYTKPIWPK